MTRKVTIINSKTQSQHVIQSEATTLGELKSEMSNAGIDYEDMAFYEGHMRAELKDDASPLPTNIPYKGRTVNDLVFMLTVPDKKVASGANLRAELYAKIKEYGLQNCCIDKYGRNYTQCSSAQLQELLEAASNEPCNDPSSAGSDYDIDPISPYSFEGTILKAFKELVDYLNDRDYISNREAAHLSDMLNLDNLDLYKKESPKKEEMSQDEIDEMFDFI